MVRVVFRVLHAGEAISVVQSQEMHQKDAEELMKYLDDFRGIFALPIPVGNRGPVCEFWAELIDVATGDILTDDPWVFENIEVLQLIGVSNARMSAVYDCIFYNLGLLHLATERITGPVQCYFEKEYSTYAQATDQPLRMWVGRYAHAALEDIMHIRDQLSADNKRRFDNVVTFYEHMVSGLL